MSLADPAFADPLLVHIHALLTGELSNGASGYHEISPKEAATTDMLIRDVPDEVIAALEAHARRLGVSRTEYVRRRLAQDAVVSDSPVSLDSR